MQREQRSLCQTALLTPSALLLFCLFFLVMPLQPSKTVWRATLDPECPSDSQRLRVLFRLLALPFTLINNEAM